MDVLLAEDDFYAAQITKRMLEKAGYGVVVAEDGLEAWKHFMDHRYRLIITDWMMPEMDGLSLCQKIRNAKLPYYVYILIVTAREQTNDAVKGLQAGADDYIVKPVDPDELTARVRVGQRIIRLEDEQREAQLQLLQAEKLASIGQLAAGIAHEINTPLQYISDNAQFLRESMTSLIEVIDAYEEMYFAVRNGGATERIMQKVAAARQASDLEALTQEIPLAIKQSLEGLDHAAGIVHAMKDFSHPGSDEKVLVDINKTIATILTVARNEWKYVAHVVTDFDKMLPPVPCLPGELNQAILNVIVNAAHAIADAHDGVLTTKGTITVMTRRDGNWAELRIADTGVGIPYESQTRIFDPFFTTKEPGRGTGQGLAIVHGVIVKRHGGTLCCKTEEGSGTTFVIRLPLGVTLPLDRERYETPYTFCR